MTQSEDTGSPGWKASFFMQTTEDVAKAVAAAATAATTVRSPRPSVVFSSKEDSGNSQLQKLQRQVTRVLKGFTNPVEMKRGNYNPEVLTSQKRQWANFQLRSLDQRSLKEPTRLFESMVVVGLHPNSNVEALQRQFFARKSEGSGKLRSALSSQSQSRVEPNLEPQILFAYPPERQLPLKYKDLLSFCFPGGVEVVRPVERTPSMSEINEILLAQEHLKQSDLSFVFRLQVADDSTLYGCCVLAEEIVQNPSRLISLITDNQPFCSFSRHVLTTRRCYCILSRLPFFELHFGVLNSIFTEERLERLTKDIGVLDLGIPHEYSAKEDTVSIPEGIIERGGADNDILDRTEDASEIISGDSTPREVYGNGSYVEDERRVTGAYNVVVPTDVEIVIHRTEKGSGVTVQDNCVTCPEKFVAKQMDERHLPNAVLPLLRYQYESSESSNSFQVSPDDSNFRSDNDGETDEASSSGHEDSIDHNDILEWAKANNLGSLQIICEYHRLRCPARGTRIRFHPLEHLHPVEYCRPDETVLHIAGSTIDSSSCKTSLELAEVHNALLVEEEATALSVWAIACICGSLRLEHVLMLFAAALLEKQIVVVCSNLGVLSASVLSIVPLIRPFQWQSLLMPVGVKNKSTDVQSKLTNVVLVDANKNQVKSPTIPQLPNYKNLLSSLSPYYAKLVGESFLGRKRPIYECTDIQIEAAKGFLTVLRSYLDSLCSNLRSHTITNVQSNDDKVSLLLKESFIDSFPWRDRPFMKLFVDTQLFSVQTDLILSFFQKE
ncbi:uDENN domain [Dillenia turbinata]|uniref:UDENN domain n=1 Tax=Dillenia turbinata TaxID=194707 RepID=A0AAN8VUN5_9MAGN